MKPYRLATPAQARRVWKALHWAADDSDVEHVRMRVASTKGELVGLGALTAVEYATTKGRDGASVYRHDFADGEGGSLLLPVLCISSDRRLVIAGGTYTVNTRGIVG